MAEKDPRRERRPDQPVLDAMALLDAGRGTVDDVRKAARDVLADGSLLWDEHVTEREFLRDVLPNRSDDEIKFHCRGMAQQENVEVDDRAPIVVKGEKGETIVALLSCQELWELYASRVVPGGASPVLRRELRMAFYGGLASLYDIVTFGITNESLTEDEVEEYLGRVRAELAHYHEILLAELGARQAQADRRIILPGE